MAPTHLWRSFEKCEHAPSDAHVHWNLSRHPAQNEHLLTCKKIKKEMKHFDIKTIVVGLSLV